MTAASEYLDALREESAYQRDRREDAAERWGEVPEPIVLPSPRPKPPELTPKEKFATHFAMRERYCTTDPPANPEPVWHSRVWCRDCGCAGEKEMSAWACSGRKWLVDYLVFLKTEERNREHSSDSKAADPAGKSRDEAERGTDEP